MKNKIRVHDQPRPFMKWQTGEYERFHQIKHSFPISFLLLCKLTGITPRQILTDFADNLSCSGWKRQGRDIAKQHLINYFIAHKYGETYYSPEEIREIFSEMDAVGRLFPKGDDEMISIYGQWRDKHYKSWFKTWYTKNRRV